MFPIFKKCIGLFLAILPACILFFSQSALAQTPGDKKSVFGFTQYGDWIFNRTSITGEAGIQKLTVHQNDSHKDAGFLSNSEMFHIVSPMQGYANVNKMWTLDDDGSNIAGTPQSRYAHSNEQCITEIEGNIYLWMANAANKENGYYLLDPTTNTAKKAFNVTDGGLVSGFVRLGK